MSSDRSEMASEFDDGVDPAGSTQDELSLEQLSQAYAQVLQEQNESAGQAEPPEHSAGGPARVTEAENDRNADPNDENSAETIEARDNAPCPISPRAIAEAVLFVGAPSGETLTAKKLAAVMREVSPREVKQAIAELNHVYEQENAAYRIVEESGSFHFKLTDDLREVQDFFFGRHRAARLSQSAIDVLAIVAYNQPVSSARIDDIRARPSAAVLSQLLRRDLVAVETTEKKQPKNYRTTDRFLNLFGLESLDDLPQTSVVSDLEELTDL